MQDEITYILQIAQENSWSRGHAIYPITKIFNQIDFY